MALAWHHWPSFAVVNIMCKGDQHLPVLPRRWGTSSAHLWTVVISLTPWMCHLFNLLFLHVVLCNFQFPHFCFLLLTDGEHYWTSSSYSPRSLMLNQVFFQSPSSCSLEGFLGVSANGSVRLTPQSLTRCHILHRPGARSGARGEKAGAATQETGMQVNYRGAAGGWGPMPGAGQLWATFWEEASQWGMTSASQEERGAAADRVHRACGLQGARVSTSVGLRSQRGPWVASPRMSPYLGLWPPTLRPPPSTYFWVPSPARRNPDLPII